jgi:hypothetical protein
MDEQENKWSDSYDTAWQQVALPILLKELIFRKIVKPPRNPSEFKKTALSLADYYSAFPQVERMKILAKYSTMRKDELYHAGREIIKSLNLKFS